MKKNMGRESLKRVVFPAGLLLMVVAVLCLFLLPGCGSKAPAEPKSIHIVGDAVLPLGLNASASLAVIVNGKPTPTLLGGEQKHVVAELPLRFEVVRGPANGDLALKQSNVTTDHGGKVMVDFHSGAVPGAYTIRVDAPSVPELKPVTFRVLAGIRLAGIRQDGPVSKALAEPLVILTESAPGVPAAGVQVRVEDGRYASVLAADEVTSTAGRAEAVVRLGKKAGPDTIMVLVRDPRWTGEDGPVAIPVPVFALDWTGLAIQVIGGLAIFIFGMRLMSDGLSLVAGDRLRALLHALTRNRFFAVAAGVITTGLIQSSSACSVMVIGFVNAGLMQLNQAIGVIMGANIGTTVTAQMLSFKLGKFALPAIAIGVVVTLIAKRRSTQFWAQILIGFGLLFYGMSIMGAPLKVLKDSATIVSFFDNLSCAPGPDGVLPFGMLLKAALAGTTMTLIVQSSSAAIGVLLAMASANLIDPYTATAVLLGDNIGTTITAVLASIGSTQTAKRTACAHVLFNCTGVVLMLVLFYVPLNGHPIFMEVIDRMTPGDVFKGENLPRFLANAHTAFNVTCTLVLIWLVGPLAVLCRRIIRQDDPQQGGLTRLLEPHLLASPSIALGQAWAELGVMLDKGHEAYRMSFSAMMDSGGDGEWEEKSDSIRTHENEVDELQGAITAYVTNLSQELLTEAQSENLPHLLHSVNDAERVGDISMSLLKLARRRRKQNLLFAEDDRANLLGMNEVLEELYLHCAATLKALPGWSDEERAERAAMAMHQGEELHKKLKRREKESRKGHEQRASGADRDIAAGVIYVNVLASISRAGAHLLNILQARCR